MKVSMIYPYYDNPSMLRLQCDNWSMYTDGLKDEIELIIVDDGSTEYPAYDVLKSNPTGIKTRLFRVKEDIPWNQHGARNLGAKMAEGEWLWMSDMDMVLPCESAEHLFKNPDPDLHYVTRRIKITDLKEDGHHCNTFLVTREAYWKVGGYDEDYCGTYGGDGSLNRALCTVAKKTLSEAFVYYYPRDVYTDAATQKYEREGYYKKEYRKRFDRKRAIGDIVPKNPIRFDWEELCLN